jgi:hypothetical protein
VRHVLHFGLEDLVPHTTHRIDLVVVSVDPDSVILDTAFLDLKRSWSLGKLLSGDSAGDERGGLISGGFERLWLDLPGRMVLYANQQGGFRVRCPVAAKNIASEFGAALVRWRTGEERSLICPACGQVHKLEECVTAPPAAFGSSAIVFSDAVGIQLSERARRDLVKAIGPIRVVLRRTV